MKVKQNDGRYVSATSKQTKRRRQRRERQLGGSGGACSQRSVYPASGRHLIGVHRVRWMAPHGPSWARPALQYVGLRCIRSRTLSAQRLHRRPRRPLIGNTPARTSSHYGQDPGSVLLQQPTSPVSSRLQPSCNLTSSTAAYDNKFSSVFGYSSAPSVARAIDFRSGRRHLVARHAFNSPVCLPARRRPHLFPHHVPTLQYYSTCAGVWNIQTACD